MSKFQRFLDEVKEARKQDCPQCGHPNSKHAFDIVVSDRPTPCQLSCMICFDTETERLKREGLLK